MAWSSLKPVAACGTSKRCLSVCHLPASRNPQILGKHTHHVPFTDLFSTSIKKMYQLSLRCIYLMCNCRISKMTRLYEIQVIWMANLFVAITFNFYNWDAALCFVMVPSITLISCVWGVAVPCPGIWTETSQSLLPLWTMMWNFFLLFYFSLPQ